MYSHAQQCWEEGAGDAIFLLCLQDPLVYFTEGELTPFLPWGKGKRKQHLGQHKSCKGQVAELSPAAGRGLIETQW